MASPLHYYMPVVVFLSLPFGVCNVTSVRQYRSLGSRGVLSPAPLLPRGIQTSGSVMSALPFSLRLLPASSVGIWPCFRLCLCPSSTYRALCSDHGTTCPCSTLSRVPHWSRAAYRPQPPLHQLHGCPCVSHSRQAPSSLFIGWISLPPRRHGYLKHAGRFCGSPGPALWPAFFPRFHFVVVSPYRRSLTLFGS